jgi:predicted extracellular nuclease
MFYNTENFFDTIDDPKTNDNEYLPEGSYHWTPKRYLQKLQNTYKVITSLGEWSPPEIIAFCEIENRQVLTDLLSKTPLARYKYDLVHFDSPDPRGIDVALLYRSDKLKLAQKKYIPVIFPEKYKEHKTRNILLAKFLINGSHPFYVFVNHWPSRRSGEKESDNFRFWTAKILKMQTDSIFANDINARIIIVGDFNDEPNDESIKTHLAVSLTCEDAKSGNLYNLSADFLKNQKTGTLKFQGQWLTFDQIIVSGALLNSSKGLSTSPMHAKVFDAPFILQTDNRNLGYIPFRTYSGRKYTGGYSDHLPVYIDLFLKK